jgi:hypothetical protein
MSSWLLPFLYVSNTHGEPLQFLAIEHRGVDHAAQQVFNRPGTELVHDTLHSSPGNDLARRSRPIEKLPVLNCMRETALLFKAA